mgnify:CR=1 FL=1
MARRPYFSGNYGSALGSTANAANLIARAGEVQGQMYANLGQQIGGAIEKYQLNKEKQKKNEGFIKSQSGMLDMLAEQDPEMASQYSAMKEQLNNPDVPLATRAEFGKNLVNNITLSTQLKGQKLLQDTQAQTLKEKRNTELLREDLLKQKQKYNNLGIELQELAVTKGKKLSAAEIKDTLDKYGFAAQQREADATLIQPRTDATRSALNASGLKSDIELADAMNRGGVVGVAKEMEKDRELNRQKVQSQIDYANNTGLAQLYKSLAEKNPTFAEQFTPLAALQDKLRGLTVKTPKGESVSYAEYEKLHNEDPDLYPMNNEPGAIRGQIESVNSQIYNLSREQTVQVDVPDEINDQATQQAQPPIPAYKKAIDDIGKQTQQEYMNQPGIGGMGFPFMP